MSHRMDLRKANRSAIAALYQEMRSRRLQGARRRLTEDAVATTPRPRHEVRESQGDLALRHLYPRLDRARPGAGVQLARQPAGSIRGLHQEPGPRRLEADAGPAMTTADSPAGRWTG